MSVSDAGICMRSPVVDRESNVHDAICRMSRMSISHSVPGLCSGTPYSHILIPTPSFPVSQSLTRLLLSTDHLLQTKGNSLSQPCSCPLSR